MSERAGGLLCDPVGRLVAKVLAHVRTWLLRPCDPADSPPLNCWSMPLRSRYQAVPTDAADRNRVDGVISDPDSGCCIIVSRIVSGAISAKQHRGCAEDEVSQHFWSFYGYERLNEVITVHDERVRVVLPSPRCDSGGRHSV